MSQDIDAEIVRLYNQHAPKYHELRLNPNYTFFNAFIEFPAMRERLEYIVKDKSVLDMGCGSGIFAWILKAWGANVKGVDVSEEMINIARSEYPDIEFQVSDARKTPFDPRSFNIVASSLMVHYCEDLKPLFSEVYRLLFPRGLFVFSTGHPLFEALQDVLGDMISGKTEVRLEPYFRKEKLFYWTMYDEKLNPLFTMPAYRHNFQDITNTLGDVGFTKIRIFEPKPSPESRDYNPKVYDFAVKFPTFIIVEAKRD